MHFERRNILNLIATALFLVAGSTAVKAQQPVLMSDTIPQHIFAYGEIQSLEDPKGTLSFADIRSPAFRNKFAPNKKYTPKIFHLNSYYWFKIRIKNRQQSRERWILEFFDQTIDDITLYMPSAGGFYNAAKMGDSYDFYKRGYKHKNFTVNIDHRSNAVSTFYIRLKSSQSANVIIVLRNLKRFVEYAVEEYLLFGLFYGMITVFSFYNLLMFFAIRQRQYLYYVLYNLSIGLYEMCIDGIAFQYLWPHSPAWNQYSYGYALFFSTIFGLLFTLNFLYLRLKAPRLYKVVAGLIILRVMFFIACLFYPYLFTFKPVEFIPLIAALYSGIYLLRKGFRPARFFVVGYSFLLLGVIVKILILLNVSWLPYGPLTHYSLSICFVLEMVLVSFAIGDNVRHLRKKKAMVQKRMITQLEINQKLKDTLNNELTSLVDERTREVVDKALIIEHQNEELSAVNILLKEQAEEISRMNVLLEKDNQELQVNIDKVTRARVMSADVDFAEFSKIYPDRETCYKYLSELKWDSGYCCRKCGNRHYLSGQLPYSRRCSKCRYDESVISNTLFQNSRIPINKAFYMLFLVYTTKGKISSHKLSELLDIRQSTCWVYGTKMKKLLEERRRELKNAGEKGWSKIVIEA